MSTLKYSIIAFGLVAGLASPTAALATNYKDACDRGHKADQGDHKDHKEDKNHKHTKDCDHKNDHKNDRKNDHKDHKNHDKDCDGGHGGGSTPTPTPKPSTTPAPSVTPTPVVTPSVTPAPTTTPAPVGGSGAGQVLSTNTTLPATGAADLGLEAAVALGLGAAGFVLVKRLGTNA